MDHVRNNPLLQHVVANPFGQSGIATGLYGALRKIEYDVMRAA
jgi:hypothetical protein